jgi:hypothetical protein
MATTTTRTAKTLSTAAEHSPKALTNGPAIVTEHDIARRAYELYLARDREPGHDLEDWLAAERELRERLRSTARQRKRPQSNRLEKPAVR